MSEEQSAMYEDFAGERDAEAPGDWAEVVAQVEEEDATAAVRAFEERVREHELLDAQLHELRQPDVYADGYDAGADGAYDAMYDASLDGEYDASYDAGDDGTFDASYDAPYAPAGDAGDEARAARVLELAQTEYQHLLSLGFDDSEELRRQAIATAEQRDAQTQQMIQSAVTQALQPYEQIIAPTVINADVSAVLHAIPVQGVEAAELAGMIAEVVPMHEWQSAPVQDRAYFVLSQAKQLAYDKLMAGQFGGGRPMAPAQEPPEMLGGAQATAATLASHPRLAHEMARQRKMWPDLDDADIEELATEALGRRS